MTDFLSRWPWRGPLYGLGPKNGSIAEMTRIASDVAERHGVMLADIRGPSRLRVHSWPRHEAMAAIQATGRYSLPKIGAYFGGRHHTTVLEAIDRVTDRSGQLEIAEAMVDRHLAALARSLAMRAAA